MRGFLRRSPEVAGEEFYEFVLLVDWEFKGSMAVKAMPAKTEALHGSP